MLITLQHEIKAGQKGQCMTLVTALKSKKIKYMENTQNTYK